mgnify:CR=1 FL=1
MLENGIFTESAVDLIYLHIRIQHWRVQHRIPLQSCLLYVSVYGEFVTFLMASELPAAKKLGFTFKRQLVVNKISK